MILELAHNISVIWPNQIQNRTQRNAHAWLYTSNICCVFAELGGCRPTPIVQIALWSTWDHHPPEQK